MRIYVGNLPFSTGEAELQELFSAHGEVTSAAIITDRETGRPRGFGFVEMSDDAAAPGWARGNRSLSGRVSLGKGVLDARVRPRNGR